jgi:hypothetical protein
MTINDISDVRLQPSYLISVLAQPTPDNLTDLDLGYSTPVIERRPGALPAYPLEEDYRKLHLPSLIMLTLRDLPVELLTYFLASLPHELPALETFIVQASPTTTQSDDGIALEPREGYSPISMPRLQHLRIPDGSKSQVLLRWISFQEPLPISASW